MPARPAQPSPAASDSGAAIRGDAAGGAAGPPSPAAQDLANPLPGYMGAKSASGVAQIIIASMPPHETYIETHLGSGAIMRAKPASAHSYGVDIDPGVIAAWRAANPRPDVRLCCDDAVEFVQGFDFSAAGRALIFADPPYVLATRTSSARYRHEYTDQDHERLAAALRAAPAAVMVTGYPSPLYDRLFAGWRTLDYQSMTRAGVRTERLWMNFPAGEAFVAAHAGRNSDDRWRISKKARRWRRMYWDCPAGERAAILAEILKGPPA